MLFFLQSYKAIYTPVKMCEMGTDNTKGLLYFCQQVQKLGFKSKPDYDKLRYILQQLIQSESQKEFGEYIVDFDFSRKLLGHFNK